MSTTRRGGLGRGLAALIPSDAPAGSTPEATMAEVAVTAISANPRQPRGVFDDEELEGLAASLRDVGVLQPLVVRPSGDGGYELVAGERRLRAAQIAGLETVPVVVRHTEDAICSRKRWSRTSTGCSSIRSRRRRPTSSCSRSSGSRRRSSRAGWAGHARRSATLCA
jgi:hypothetical protein